MSVESLSVSGGAGSFRAGCETSFPCVLFLGGTSAARALMFTDRLRRSTAGA